ncbi:MULTISPECIES: MarR family winged helix-turn-helix transcriptional regulator [Myxococcus]|jgi:DNA-binding MarR family transcriptional regulator|uniref:MarR family winged helix-turn-helix transcriptional regulator n=1 Tax=Myxococcus TaxID=32 RepID=UPI00114184B8|nr:MULTISPECIES: MarR family transcriptional regulator [Myxococcus]MBZ4398383.1 MarR family transcriptional regulator [Myxococcus sp. AS-1-15]MCK8502119.1 MarR family transcriptional regulator [Myxococcus fulvus]
MSPSNKKRGDALHLDEQLCFTLYSTVHLLNRTYRPLLEKLGLTYPQYLAMMVLWEEDGVTVKALGERLLLDSGTLTPLLKRLESAGLLKRERDVLDERQVRIRLTASGRALRARAESVPPSILEASGCSLEELRDLKARVLAIREQLGARLGEESSAAAPRGQRKKSG